MCVHLSKFIPANDPPAGRVVKGALLSVDGRVLGSNPARDKNFH
jgi:hypothetical protein